MKFYYQGMKDGQPVDGSEEAASRADLIIELGKRGVTVDFIDVDDDLLSAAVEQHDTPTPELPERIAFHQADSPGHFIGNCLLTFGQVAAIVSCAFAVIYGLSAVAAPSPTAGMAVFGGALLVFFWSAALFVVFIRVK